jgi:hypothetical protein
MAVGRENDEYEEPELYYMRYGSDRESNPGP